MVVHELIDDKLTFEELSDAALAHFYANIGLMNYQNTSKQPKVKMKTDDLLRDSDPSVCDNETIN
jgi:hypothetical protein